jgi:hypothetical protein
MLLTTHQCAIRESFLRCGATVVGVLLAGVMLTPSGATAISIEKLFRFEDPPSGFYGAYDGDAVLVLGQLRDETFAQSPRWIGYIEMKTPRVERIQTAIEHFLSDTGLSAASDRESGGGRHYRLDVTIRRYRLSEWPVAHRDIRLRGEVFLEFVISDEEQVVASVLACGNAEHAFTKLSANKHFKRFGLVHGAAVDDAFVKLTQSKGFGALFGTGWSPGPARRPLEAEVTIGRIDRTVAYGPSAPALALAARLRSLFPSRMSAHLSIEDFALRDEDYLDYLKELEEDSDDIDEDEEERASLAGRWLPEVLREVLAAYYPETSLEVSRDGEAEAGGVVLSGEVYRFDTKGSKQKLEADVSVALSGSAEPLHTLHVYWISGSANAVWSFLVSIIESGVDAKRLSKAQEGDTESDTYWIGQAYGGVSTMADEWAHNVAWALVEALERPEDRVPTQTEVVFEGFAPPQPAVPASESAPGTP